MYDTAIRKCSKNQYIAIPEMDYKPQYGKGGPTFRDYKKNNLSTDRENGRGTKRARVTRGSRNLKPYAPL
jgi:hypothetical protein